MGHRLRFDHPSGPRPLFRVGHLFGQNHLKIRFGHAARQNAAALFWQGDASCQPPGNATIWLRVQDGTAYGYAHVDGVLPRAGAAARSASSVASTVATIPAG